MARRSKTASDQPLPEQSTDVFTEVEPSRSPNRKKGVKVLFTDDGVDWTGVSDEQKVDVMSTIAADDDIAATFRAFNGSESSPASNDLLITEDHLNFFLDAVEAAEQFFIPRMIARKSVGGLPAGAFKISPSVAKAAFKFENREKLISPGVEAANRNLPASIKKLIAKVGPGTKFIGLFFNELRQQQVRAITLQIAEIQKHRAQHHNQNHTGSPAARRGKQQPTRVGGDSTTEAAAAAQVDFTATTQEEQIA
jgi:hypothetical protein